MTPCVLCNGRGFVRSSVDPDNVVVCVCRRGREIFGMAQELVMQSEIGTAVGYTQVIPYVYGKPRFTGGPTFQKSPISQHLGNAIITVNWVEFQQTLYTLAVSWVYRHFDRITPQGELPKYKSVMPDLVRVTSDLKIRERNFKRKEESHIDLAQFDCPGGLLIIRMGQSGKNASTGSLVFEVCQEASNNGHKVWLVSDTHRPLNLKPETMSDMADWVTAAKPERFNLASPDNDPSTVDLDALLAASEPDDEPDLKEPENVEEHVLDELN